jgi:hypothetical protein
MITNSKKFLLILVAVCFSGMLSAQSIYWNDGKELIRKIDANTYEPVPAGAVSYKISDNKCLQYINGDIDEATPIFRYEANDNKVNFYKNDQLLGYYKKSEGRYYKVSLLSDGTIGKEDTLGVLLNGKLYNSSGKVRLTIDNGIPSEVIGLFLFIIS